MIQHEYELVSLSMIHGIDFSMGDDNIVVISTDTGKDMNVDGVWRPDTGYVTCVVFLTDDRLHVYCRTADADPEFMAAVADRLRSYKGKALYAFNKSTEEGNLFSLLGKNVIVEEINTTGKRWKMVSFYSMLWDRGIIAGKAIEIPDPITDPMGCITLWQKYEKEGDHELLGDLIQHTMSCVLREAVVLKHIEEIKQQVGT